MSSLGNPMDSPLRETAEHSITTPVASGTAAPLPPRNNRSTAWDHFTVETGEEKKARCNYCGILIKYRDGTSGMQTHLKRCKKNPYTVPNKRPRTGASSQTVEGQGGGGVGSLPTYFKFDQEVCRAELVKMFYDATIRISSSYYVTSNIYMKEVFAIGRKIRQCQEHSDDRISLMATRMRSKYDKYWGRPSSINILLLIAVVLDPRRKLEYVNTFLGYLFDIDQAEELKLKLPFGLRSLYEQYQGIEESSQINQEVMLDEDDDDVHGMGFYLQVTGRKFDTKSELDKYLKEDAEPFNKLVEFDILTWWRVNSARFPILGNIAREVLAIPVSTVASESAFSTGGRVLDPYRSPLTPKMVEALVCTQDWLKGTPFSMLSNEDFEELERFEQEMTSPHEGTSSVAIDLDD